MYCFRLVGARTRRKHGPSGEHAAPVAMCAMMSGGETPRGLPNTGTTTAVVTARLRLSKSVARDRPLDPVPRLFGPSLELWWRGSSSQKGRATCRLRSRKRNPARVLPGTTCDETKKDAASNTTSVLCDERITGVLHTRSHMCWVIAIVHEKRERRWEKSDRTAVPLVAPRIRGAQESENSEAGPRCEHWGPSDCRHRGGSPHTVVKAIDNINASPPPNSI